jgi:hypothetical protein
MNSESYLIPPSPVLGGVITTTVVPVVPEPCVPLLAVGVGVSSSSGCGVLVGIGVCRRGRRGLAKINRLVDHNVLDVANGVRLVGLVEHEAD